ncbi:DUF6630 family protein [Brachybacterium sp. DNPG3]
MTDAGGTDAGREGAGRAHAQDWLRLAALIDDDPELLGTMRLALDDPAAYRDLHADDLHVDPSAEDDDRAAPLAMWTVLLDGLDESSALAYLDIEDTGCELVDALAGVRPALRCGACFEDVADVDDLFAAIHRAEQLLAGHGLRLLQLPDDDDEAIPLVAVPQESVADIVALAEHLGHEAIVFA